MDLSRSPAYVNPYIEGYFYCYESTNVCPDTQLMRYDFRCLPNGRAYEEGLLFYYKLCEAQQSGKPYKMCEFELRSVSVIITEVHLRTNRTPAEIQNKMESTASHEDYT
jgi:hypothetical protein